MQLLNFIHLELHLLCWLHTVDVMKTMFCKFLKISSGMWRRVFWQVFTCRTRRRTNGAHPLPCRPVP
jgi:hypothetical protein